MNPRKRGGKSFGKKAQITVFIIIGIILVFSVGIYSYLRSTGTGPVEVFRPKSPPVVAFVEACIEQTAEEAIRAMGDQGGYIVLPPQMRLNPAMHVSLVPGVGGEFAPKVPYWYYEGKTQIPGIGYMEHETREYINDNLRYCINNYDGLSDEYDVKEISNYSADVMFTDNEAIISLDYEIEVTPRGSDQTIKRDEFQVRLDVKVKRMWELSKKILEQENKRTFFENMTLDLMASHPSSQIPFTGMQFDCTPRQWTVRGVKDVVIDALEPAVGSIRFEGTDLPLEWEGDEDDYAAVHRAVTEWKESEVVRPIVLPDYIPSDSYDYFQYFFRFDEKADYRDLHVISSFNRYWGMKLLATPNEYGIMKSQSTDLKSQIISSIFCLNRYHFVYDLVYPVMISVSDTEAFHGSGYVFRYAFPVQILHNTGDRSMLPATIIEPTEFELDFCDFFSDDEHTIIVRDAATNRELSKVNLTFNCLREQCYLGATRTNNRHLQWSGPFPDGCAGAVIIAERDGYLRAEKQYTGVEPFYIDMYPTHELRFEVRRFTENAPTVPRFIDPDMYAIVQIELADPPYSVFEVYGGGEIFNRSETIELIRDDAEYELNLMLLKKISDDEDRWVGGWIGNWSVRRNEILDAALVQFPVLQKMPTPPAAEDMDPEDMFALYGMITNRSLYPEVVPKLTRADEYSPDSEDGEGQDAGEAGGEV